MNRNHFRKLCFEGRKHNKTYRNGFVMLHFYKSLKMCYYTNEIGNVEELRYVIPADYSYQYITETKYKGYNLVCYHRFYFSR